MSLISVATYLLLPPASLAWLALLALLLPRRMRPRLVAAALLVPLVLLSTPLVAVPLLRSLDLPPAAPPAELPQAIVILSAEVERTGEGGLEVGPLTLERERAGAALQRSTGLPVLVSGGIINGPPPVGALMAHSLQGDFAVPVRWAETRSGTTWENAQLSAAILRPAGITRVFLVTHAWHMRRALLAFERAGLDAVPAPVRRDPGLQLRLGALEPNIASWVRSFYAIHEWVGLLFYQWRS